MAVLWFTFFAHVNGLFFRSENYTRNEWGRSKTTLETSGEDVRLHGLKNECFSVLNEIHDNGGVVSVKNLVKGQI